MSGSVRLRPGYSQWGECGRKEEGQGPSVRKSHNLNIGLFSYTQNGYKEHLNVQQLTSYIPTPSLCLNC